MQASGSHLSHLGGAHAFHLRSRVKENPPIANGCPILDGRPGAPSPAEAPRDSGQVAWWKKQPWSLCPEGSQHHGAEV